MSTLTVVDYDCGNLFSIRHAIEHCGSDVRIATTAADILSAERLILPGVGAFGDAAEKLRARGLTEAVQAFAASGRPFLGICVGMQLMFDTGEEFGIHQGLGIVAGTVCKIDEVNADGDPRRIPHIGWSSVVPADGADWQGSILPNDGTPFDAYFLHSFQCIPKDDADRLAVTDFEGTPVTASVHAGNCWGCQFHPEKSGEAGLDILRRFIDIGAAS